MTVEGPTSKAAKKNAKRHAARRAKKSTEDATNDADTMTADHEEGEDSNEEVHDEANALTEETAAPVAQPDTREPLSIADAIDDVKRQISEAKAAKVRQTDCE